MEITLHTISDMPIFAVTAGFMLLIFLAVAVFVLTGSDHLIAGGAAVFALMFIGIFAVIGVRVFQSETREDLATVAEEELGIVRLEPVRGGDGYRFCKPDLGETSKEYTWIDEEGDSVEGTIERSAERNGECTFTLTPNS